MIFDFQPFLRAFEGSFFGQVKILVAKNRSSDEDFLNKLLEGKS